MKLSISEILDVVSQQPTRKEKVEMLQKFDNTTLRTVLQLCFDPRAKWVLPEGKPPFKPNEFLNQQGNLYSEIRKMYLFLEGGSPNLKPIKRESLFISFLEGIDAKDAELICSIKDKIMPYAGITAGIVNKAFPGLIEGV